LVRLRLQLAVGMAVIQPQAVEVVAAVMVVSPQVPTQILLVPLVVREPQDRDEMGVVAAVAKVQR